MKRIFDCKSVKSLDWMPRIYTFQRWMKAFTGQPAVLRGLTARDESNHNSRGGMIKIPSFSFKIVPCEETSELSQSGEIQTVLQQWLWLPFLFCEYVYVNLKLCLFIKKHWTGRTDLFSIHLF